MRESPRPTPVRASSEARRNNCRSGRCACQSGSRPPCRKTFLVIVMKRACGVGLDGQPVYGPLRPGLRVAESPDVQAVTGQRCLDKSARVPPKNAAAGSLGWLSTGQWSRSIHRMPSPRMKPRPTPRLDAYEVHVRGFVDLAWRTSIVKGTLAHLPFLTTRSQRTHRVLPVISAGRLGRPPAPLL